MLDAFSGLFTVRDYMNATLLLCKRHPTFTKVNIKLHLLLVHKTIFQDCTYTLSDISDISSFDYKSISVDVHTTNFQARIFKRPSHLII